MIHVRKQYQLLLKATVSNSQETSSNHLVIDTQETIQQENNDLIVDTQVIVLESEPQSRRPSRKRGRKNIRSNNTVRRKRTRTREEREKEGQDEGYQVKRIINSKLNRKRERLF